MTKQQRDYEDRMNGTAPSDLDEFFIDDEFDDFLDQHVAQIRDSLADFRNA